MSPLLLLHIAATLVMVGIIWFVQLVHYPLFAKVGASGFARYEAAHTRRTTWVVAPPMLIELATAVPLVWSRPAYVPAWCAWLGVALLGLIWVSTAFVQVPLHGRLADGFVAGAHQRLVNSNWVRTVA